MPKDESLPSALRERFSLLGLEPTDADLERMLPFAIDLDAAAARLRVARAFDQTPSIGPSPSDAKARPDV